MGAVPHIPTGVHPPDGPAHGEIPSRKKEEDRRYPDLVSTYLLA